MWIDLNRKQKLVLAVLAFAIGWFLFLEIADEGISGTRWLVPLLVIGSICVLIALPTRAKAAEARKNSDHQAKIASAEQAKKDLADLLERAEQNRRALTLIAIVEDEARFLRNKIKARGKLGSFGMPVDELNSFFEAEVLKVAFSLVSLAEHNKNGMFLKDSTFTYLQLQALARIEHYVEQDVWKAIEGGHLERGSVESVKDRIKKAGQREIREVAKVVQMAAARSDEPPYLAIAVSFAPRLGFGVETEVIKKELCAEYLEPVWLRQTNGKG